MTQLIEQRSEMTREHWRASVRRSSISHRALAVVVVLVVVVALNGLLIGHRYGAMSFHAETRLMVGEQTISAQAVPGYSLATQQLAENYARLVSSDSVAKSVSQKVSGGDIELRATAVASSSVIRIEATANSSARAVSAATAAATGLQSVVTAATRDSGQLNDVERQLSAAQKVLAQKQQAQREAEKALGSGGSSPSNSLNNAALTAQADAQVAQVRVNALTEGYRTTLLAGLSGSSTISVQNATQATGTDAAADGQIGGLVGGVLTAVLCALVIWLRRRGDEH